MSLYRGAGGASDATDDSTVNAVAGYASSAASSATSAASSATAASSSAGSAATSASNAASSASSVATNATNAASSASLANTYAADANLSKEAAAASAVIANTKAGEATASASTASSASSTATTKAGEAASSASEAAAAAVASADSAADALAIYGNTAAMNAAVASAASSASTSSTQAANSAASAAAADASEVLAYEHEQNAAEWATVAQGSANNAQAYSSAALAARDAALSAYDSFDDRYLGVKSADPTVDNDGNPLIAGSLYFNDQTNMMMLRTSTAWVAAYTSGGTPSFGNTIVNGTLNVTGTISGDLTGNVTGNVSGNAGTVTNGVYTTGAQTIAGTKTFSSSIVGSITGNAATATTATNVSGGTASVTTLTTSSTVTLNGGTANGVPYLNGSKVLTTGSALTFDGTGMSVTGSTSATLKLNGRASDNASSANFYDNTGATRYGFFYFDPNNAQIATTNATPLAFLINSSEQMRLTSTGLGIGTSSPSRKLTVASETAGLPTLGTGSGGLFLSSNNGLYGLYGGVNGSTGDTWLQAMRNDSALAYNIVLNPVGGNLGIGTSSPADKLQIGVNSSSPGFAAVRESIWENFTDTDYVSAYNNGGANNNGMALLIGNAGRNGTAGTVRFALGLDAPNGAAMTAAIGTASNHPLSFGTNSIERMRLDSSGNLGLGVTPSAWSALAGGNAIQLSSGGLYSYSNFATGLSENSYYANGDKYIATGVAAAKYLQNAGEHAWFNAPSGTAGNAISFTQAMTLDASGNLLVGTTTAASLVDSSSPAGGGYFGVAKTNDCPVLLKRTGTDGAIILFAKGGVGNVGSISVTTTATAYNTSSDYRLKENIQPMTGALAKVAALKPVTYTWKADGSAGEGFIAHELAEVCPAAVTGEKDAVDAEGKPQYQGIDVSFLVGTLTAAIQEQQAIIEDMKNRLAALEAA